MTHVCHISAHTPVHDREAGPRDGFLTHQLGDMPDTHHRVDQQLIHLHHQLVKVLEGQLVEDSPEAPHKFLHKTHMKHYFKIEIN